MSKNDDYATGNLLDFLMHQNHWKLISIDLSSQNKTNISQQNNFTGNSEEDDGASFLKKQF